MRTALTRFFPFSQDQTPIWNEFCYNCNFSLQAKRCPARGQSLSVIREHKSPQSRGPALPSPSLGCVWLVKPNSWETQSSHLGAFRGRKAFCSCTIPLPLLLLLPAFCCRVICSRWEVNTFCFLSLSLLLLQFTSIFFLPPPPSRSQLTSWKNPGIARDQRVKKWKSCTSSSPTRSIFHMGIQQLSML